MKKIIMLKGLDCAHCAEKIESSVKKIKGVEFAAISFIASKMSVQIVDGMEDVVCGEIIKIVRKIEPDVKVIM